MSKLLKQVATTVISLMFLTGITYGEDNLSSQVVLYNPINLDNIKKPELDFKQLECLARNIFFESGAEDSEGKIAVGMVTINRSEHFKWPNTVCEVVKQRTTVVRRIVQDEEIVETKRTVCQFSWTCITHRAIDETTPQWQHSLAIARYLLEGGYDDHSEDYGDLLYFHSAAINPGWHNLKRVVKIGNQVFYTEQS